MWYENLYKLYKWRFEDTIQRLWQKTVQIYGKSYYKGNLKNDIV